MKRMMMAFGLMLAMTACQAERNMTTAERSETTTVYQLRDFTGIDVSGIAQVIFTQGPSFFVEVEESPNPDLITKVEKRGQTLYVSTEQKRRGVNIGSNDNPLVRITAPDLAAIKLSGVTVFNTSQITGRDLRIDISGASKMETGLMSYDKVVASTSGACKVAASVKAEGIDLESSGACKLTLNMEAERLKMTCSGATTSDLTLVGGSADVDCSGAGKIDLKLVDCKKLKAHNSGATKFTISGNADDTTIDASGVAKIDTSRLNQY